MIVGTCNSKALIIAKFEIFSLIKESTGPVIKASDENNAFIKITEKNFYWYERLWNWNFLLLNINAGDQDYFFFFTTVTFDYISIFQDGI